MRKSLILIFAIFIFVVGCGKKCPDGYNLEDDVCVVILEENAIVTNEYYCVTGTLINNKCYLVNSSQVIPAQSFYNSNKYYCNYGYNLNGNMCYPIAHEPSSRVVTTCPSGYTKNKSGVAGIEVPQIDLPGVATKCYKRVTSEPR